MTITYKNEREYIKASRNLKSLDMTAFKQLSFDIIPDLQKGHIKKLKKDGNLYVAELNTPKVMERVYDTKYKLVLDIKDDVIEIVGLEPRELLLTNYEDIISYKGCPIPKDNSKIQFKAELTTLIASYYDD